MRIYQQGIKWTEKVMSKVLCKTTASSARIQNRKIYINKKGILKSTYKRIKQYKTKIEKKPDSFCTILPVKQAEFSKDKQKPSGGLIDTSKLSELNFSKENELVVNSYENQNQFTPKSEFKLEDESTNKDIKYELNNQEILENLPKRINDNLNHRPESIKIKKNECDINEEQDISPIEFKPITKPVKEIVNSCESSSSDSKGKYKRTNKNILSSNEKRILNRQTLNTPNLNINNCFFINKSKAYNQTKGNIHKHFRALSTIEKVRKEINEVHELECNKKDKPNCNNVLRNSSVKMSSEWYIIPDIISIFK